MVRFYVYGFSSGLIFYYALDKVLMQARGLSFSEMMWLEIAYAALVLIFEVPSGALADRWSRKYVLALNIVFFMLSTAVQAYAPNFRLFLLATMLASIHSALDSGTLTSLMYDTLDQNGRANEYEKVLGRFLMYENIAALGAGIAGGMIASRWGLVLPFRVTLIPQAAAVVAALSLHEPQIHRTTGETNYWRHMADAFRVIRKQPQIHWIIALIVLMRVTLQLADEYMQLYFVAVGIPIFFLGYLNSVGNGIEIGAGRWAWRLRKFAGSGWLYPMLMGLGGLGLVLAGYWRSPIGAVFIFLPFVAYYFSHPLLSADLHKHLDASHRATGESFVNLVRMLVFIPIGLGFSIAAEKTSLSSAYSAIGVIVLVCAALALWKKAQKT